MQNEWDDFTRFGKLSWSSDSVPTLLPMLIPNNSGSHLPGRKWVSENAAIILLEDVFEKDGIAQITEKLSVIYSNPPTYDKKNHTIQISVETIWIFVVLFVGCASYCFSTKEQNQLDSPPFICLVFSFRICRLNTIIYTQRRIHYANISWS